MVRIVERISAEEAHRLLKAPGAGAIALYVGVVRGEVEGRRTCGVRFKMSEAQMLEELGRIEEEIRGRRKIEEFIIFHRSGELRPGEEILLLGASAAGRFEALRAVEEAIERIKELHTVWKEEMLAE